MEEDWDNLIVLDSCRFDLFRDSWDGPGQLSSVLSMGSDTTEWLNRNFNDEYPDTVYVAGNPQLRANDLEELFFKVNNVWETNWNERFNTVLPEVMANNTIEAQKNHSDKRIISHWVQPHYPFIGETGAEIEHRSLSGDGIVENDQRNVSIWEKLSQGLIDEETVRQAYQENLEVALPEVRRLINELDGKTIVTSDHGNIFGKYGLYGHPGNKFIRELLEVPWLTVEGSRRNITMGKTLHVAEENVDVNERLQDLGYK
ncbi:hypothetical protein [Halolamina rubra]|uniref:hypothetical protein n=1 Tax=Halolamina rubra TaxID=1380430 RepID=UPI001377BA09|nr:hypothetical protein [Halolamina rubra]